MNLSDSLMALGFTEYEAKVYLALLAEHPATGYQISIKAGVPRSMVYEALGRLDLRGAVLKSSARRATLYRPLPPDVLLDRYEQQQRELLGSLRQNLRTLFTAQPQDNLWTIQGRGAVSAYAVQLLDEAEREVLLVLGDVDLEVLRQALRAAQRRGVQISALLTGAGRLEVGRTAIHPPLESEVQELTHTLIVVADQREALIARSDLEASATVTSNANLVLIARQFIWMELFAQRIYARLGADLLARLEPDDRQILEGYAGSAS